jgi:hypothetical protein
MPDRPHYANFYRLDVSLCTGPKDDPYLTRQIDYEFPKTPAEAEGYVHLLREVRSGLEHLAHSKGRRQGQYQLTVAAPCGMDNMEKLRVREMDQVSYQLVHIDLADPRSGSRFLELDGA